MTPDALARIDQFISTQPGLTRQGVAQPAQGSTNQVAFARQGDRLIVFKVFNEPERKERECFGLRHWHKTGLVPELIWDVDAVTIGISYIPGYWLAEARKLEGDAEWEQACREAGRAMGLLTKFPMDAAERLTFESRFYSPLGTFESYVSRIIELGRQICGRDPDFNNRYWLQNLAFIEGEVNYLLAQPCILYHQDVSNFHVQRGRFAGFFDLEMCRVGCAAMQLGASLRMLDRSDDKAWNLFRAGWKMGTGSVLRPEELRAALAAHYLLGWREICRYLSYDGTKGSGFEWAEPANPAYYQASFDGVAHMVVQI